jgi:hypothetical protein
VSVALVAESDGVLGDEVDTDISCANASASVDTEALAGPLLLDFTSSESEVSVTVQPDGAVIENVKYAVGSR